MLCNSNCDLTICDFGLARISFPHLMHRVSSMTDYVATRWYRAPEIIVGWVGYTKAVDVWGVGCILAELVLRRPIFAGANNEEQLRLITSILGCPSEETIAMVERPHYREVRKESTAKLLTVKRRARNVTSFDSSLGMTSLNSSLGI